MSIKENINNQLQIMRIERALYKGIRLKKKSMQSRNKISFYKEYDYKKIRASLKENYVPTLYDALEVLLQEEYLDKELVYENLCNYRVEEDSDIYVLTPISSDFSTYEKILHFPANAVPILYLIHELNHLINFKLIPNERLVTGFKAYIYDHGDCVIVGDGVNEAFTDFLSSVQVNGGKMIIQGNSMNESFIVNYPVCMQVGKCLSKIIGFDKMKKMYYSHNPDLLLNELCQNQDPEAVIQFYKNMDILKQNEKNNEIDIKDEMFLEINSFLSGLSINKFGKDISKEDNLEGIKKISDGSCYPRQFFLEYEKIGTIVKENKTK